MPSVLAVQQSPDQTNAVPFGVDAWPLSPKSNPDELCERLVEHVLDCDICLSIVPDLTCSSDECSKHCPEYGRIQQQIIDAGGPSVCSSHRVLSWTENNDGKS